MDLSCPLCGLYPETIGHVLWSCASATAVWKESSRKIQKLHIGEPEGLLLFEQWMAHLDDNELELVGVLARFLWLRRNTVVSRGILSPPL